MVVIKMNDLDGTKKFIREIINEYPLPKQIYTYIQQKIVIPNKVTTNFLIKNNCQICGDKIYHPLHQINETLWGTGDGKKKIMFILQNPGVSQSLRNEKLIGITRTGISCAGGGSVLRWIVQLAGCNFDKDIYTTNCVKCCTKKNKGLTAEIQKNCYPYLRKEISEFNPIKILTFGIPAKKNVNTIIKELNKKNIQIKNLPHYSYAVNREKQMKEKYHMDFADWAGEIISFLKF
jgi:uracil-DNA glycosylase family 4